MRITSRKRKKQASAEGRGDLASNIAQSGSSWSFGRSSGSRLVTGALLVGIACGPISLMVAVSSGRATATPVSTSAPGLSGSQEQSADFALGFVTAWLSATKAVPGLLAQYVDISSLGTLTETAWVYRNVQVAVIDPVDQDTVSVLVGADIQEPDASSTTGGTVWPRRYFQVAVRTTSKGLVISGVPAIVAAPASAGGMSLAYSQSLSNSQPAYQAVVAFLGAYLTGAGDISRYITPGVMITPVSPVPFAALSVKQMSADVAPADTPKDGQQLRIEAAVTVSAHSGQNLTTSYSLTLTARAGRWEITQIDQVPLIN